uniref:L-ascorbate oxidase n=1 Tax=Ananas comosus var. bracteatus TaxID=296719 RepID=A0A6V7NL26_ANACO|nr:unnamed protein product [Ananas comosus var. bracteatus]
MGKRTISRLSISISPRRPLHHHHYHHQHHQHEDHQHHLLLFLVSLALLASSNTCNCDDPYRFFTWNVTYADIWPLGGILINGQFPGPQIEAVTNDNVIINVFNSLSDPFLISWNGIQQRRNSFEDGVYGTTCPIPPGRNFTYVLQMKDQIGTYYYFPSLAFHKAAGGFGGIRVLSRPLIPVPFPPPAADYTLLIGDWFKANHTDLKYILDSGRNLPFPDSLLINGRAWNGNTFTVEQGRTYRFRITNVGLSTSLNIRFQGHMMKLVEVEGSHTLQNSFSSLDVHLGNLTLCLSLLINLLSTTALWFRPDSLALSSPPPQSFTMPTPWGRPPDLSPADPLFRSIGRLIRPDLFDGTLQLVDRDRTRRDHTTTGSLTRLEPYDSQTPHQLSMASRDTPSTAYYVEIVFENYEDSVQSWHIDGYSFWVVGMDGGQWSSASRKSYNLRDAVARCTVQVYPKSWSAIYMPLDNVGMWNVRSEDWVRQYLGQQFYLRVYTPSTSWRDEYPIPRNALLCGRASGRRTRPF